MKKILLRVIKVIGIVILLYIVFCILYFATIGFKHQVVESPRGRMRYGVGAEDAIDLSIYELLANTDKYNGVKVNVVGVANIHPVAGEDGSSIYLNKDDYTYNIQKNAFVMNIDYDTIESTAEELKQFNGKYVGIQGTFSVDKGPFSLYSGTIDNVIVVLYYEDSLFMNK